MIRIEGLETGEVQAREDCVALLAAKFARHAVGRAGHRHDEQRRVACRQPSANRFLLVPSLRMPLTCLHFEVLGTFATRFFRRRVQALHRLHEALALLALLGTLLLGLLAYAIARDRIERVLPHPRVDLLQAAGVLEDSLGGP